MALPGVAPVSVPSVDDCLWSVPPPSAGGRLHRNHWPEWIAITGRFASEYALLIGHAIESYVLEPTSILVNRRARRAKTDRLDAEGMLRVLVTYLAGDHKACSMVRVPTPDEEDAKRPHRERQHLTRERLRTENRIEALLFTQRIDNCLHHLF